VQFVTAKQFKSDGELAEAWRK